MAVNIIRIHVLIIITVIFVIIIGVIILFTFLFLLRKRKRFKETKGLQRLFYPLLERVILMDNIISEENNNQIIIGTKLHNRLVKRFPRSIIKDLILKMKSNLMDVSGENLQSLYDQIGLKNDALKNLHFGRRWFQKASAIQELSRMNQVDCLRHIYKCVNNKNKYVRMEAQSAMINLWGFRGLRFLNFIVYPISEWQQIKLLQQLSQFKYEEFHGIEKWLQSSNDSVVIFALKLVRVYHRFELYDFVVKVLHHSNPHVRKNCIITLMKIYREDTASLVAENYYHEGRDCKLAILDAMKEAGSEDVIPFLLEELEHGDNEYKLKAAEAVMTIKKSDGLLLLESQPFSHLFPWDKIIVQLKEEATV